MNPIQRKHARHALGLPNERGQSYRNRYFASPDTSAHFVWEAMRNAGWATFTASNSRHLFYELTRTGAEQSLSPGETLCPEDFPAALADPPA